MKVLSILFILILGQELYAQVDIHITKVISSEVDSKVKSDNKFFRYIEWNSEFNSCLNIDEVDFLAKENKKHVSKKICHFKEKEKEAKQAIDINSIQSVEYSEVKWQGQILHFKFNYLSNEPHSLTIDYKCSYVPRLGKDYFECIRGVSSLDEQD